MTVLGGLVGSGAGIVTLAAAWLLSRHLHHIPAASPWLARIATVLMFAGGSAVAVTSLGGWIVTAVATIAGFLGGLHSGVAFAVLTVAALCLTVGVVTDLIWSPGSGMITAAVLPLVLGLTAGGVLHQIYAYAAVPAGPVRRGDRVMDRRVTRCPSSARCCCPALSSSCPARTS